MADKEDKSLENDRMLNKAVRAMDNDDLNKAEEIHKELLRLGSNDAILFNNQGVIYGKREEPELALEFFQKARELDPSTPLYAINVAKEFIGREEPERAIEELEQVGYHFRNFRLLNLLSDLYITNGDREKAKINCKETLEILKKEGYSDKQISEEIMHTRNVLGTLYLGEGRLEDAIYEFEASLKEAYRSRDVSDNFDRPYGKDEHPLYNIFLVRQKQGDREGMQKAMDHLFREHPEYGKIMENDFPEEIPREEWYLKKAEAAKIAAKRWEELNKFKDQEIFFEHGG